MINANQMSFHQSKSSKSGRTQDWTPGMMVKVGFMTLLVTGIELTPGDYRPDRYLLESSKGIKYAFTPHFGLEKL